jgi:hypothetical protein
MLALWTPDADWLDSLPSFTESDALLGPIRASASRVVTLQRAKSLAECGQEHACVAFLSFPRPTTEPPPSVLEAEKNLGVAGFFKHLVSQEDCPIDFVVEFDLSFSEWRCPLVPKLDGAKLPKKLGRSPIRDQIGFRYPEKRRGVQEVALAYDDDRACYHVRVQGVGKLTLTAELQLPGLVKAGKSVTEAFFVRVGEGRT